MLFKASRTKEDSFMKLAYPHLSLVFNLACRLSGNRYDAEDLTQETFAIAYQKIQQLREENKCRGWLISILRNLYLRSLTKQQANLLEIDESGDDYWLSLEKYAGGINPEDLVCEASLAEEVQKLLLRLPDKYRLPLILHYSEEFSCQQIAETLDLPIGTVMSRLGRGRELLKNKLLLQRKRETGGEIIHPSFAGTTRKNGMG